ncbi:MAG TPA: SIS domain-containing protein [Alphaproteobacteria bacterium]|jgi:glucose/mannose-6-phosphate isomerase|nr:SIS domain-containing protein [Alphaproteobacteria bacterium]
MNNNLDPMGIGKALELFPEQIKTTYSQTLNSNIETLNFDSIVISGMGGSSNAGKIIQSLLEGESFIPVFVFNDYGLPAWVNEKTLVVLNSYSGNTEETLSAYEVAKQKNCKVIGVATGGKIAEVITSGEIKGVIVSAGETNPSNYPKSGLGVSFGALFGALTKVGLIKTEEAELNSALSELVEIRKTWDAKEKSNWLKDSVPVLFSSRSLIGPLNAGRNAMCEIGRVFTVFYDFPEVNHVLIEATQKPDFIKDKFKYLFFESKFDNDRIKLRYKITKEIFADQKLSTNSYVLSTSSRLSQSLELAHYCAWLGYNLSINRGEDPGPEPWIIKLKEALSQPIH